VRVPKQVQVLRVVHSNVDIGLLDRSRHAAPRTPATRICQAFRPAARPESFREAPTPVGTVSTCIRKRCGTVFVPAGSPTPFGSPTACLLRLWVFSQSVGSTGAVNVLDGFAIFSGESAQALQEVAAPLSCDLCGVPVPAHPKSVASAPRCANCVKFVQDQAQQLRRKQKK